MSTPRCGAKTRAGTPCRRPAGAGTDHPGSGRCKLHGGATPIKHGLYSTVVRGRARELLELASDESTTDATAEVQLLQAVIAGIVERIAMLDGQAEEFIPDPAAPTRSPEERADELRRTLIESLDRCIRAKGRQLDQQVGLDAVLRNVAEVVAAIIAAKLPERQRERARSEIELAILGSAELRPVARRGVRG